MPGPQRVRVVGSDRPIRESLNGLKQWHCTSFIAPILPGSHRAVPKVANGFGKLGARGCLLSHVVKER